MQKPLAFGEFMTAQGPAYLGLLNSTAAADLERVGLRTQQWLTIISGSDAPCPNSTPRSSKL